MYIRTLVFALFGNHKLKKVYKNKMFYGDLSRSLPLSKACFSGSEPAGCPSLDYRLNGSGPGLRAGPQTSSVLIGLLYCLFCLS